MNAKMFDHLTKRESQQFENRYRELMGLHWAAQKNRKRIMEIEEKLELKENNHE